MPEPRGEGYLENNGELTDFLVYWLVGLVYNWHKFC